MKFGVCKSLESSFEIKQAGYDYIEANLKSCAAMTDAEFERQLKCLKDADLACESSNCFFESDFALVGDEVDCEKVAEYADRALCRAKRLGIKVAVLGSGKARNIPDDYDRQKGVEQFKRVVGICADAGRKYGIKIAIEPLNAGETNLLNTVAETAEFCEQLGHENVGYVADFYHMFRMDEDVSIIEKTAKHLLHVHIARPNADRNAPSKKDIDTLKIWAEALKKAGYDGCISLESSSKFDFSESLKSFSSVKYVFE